MIRITGANIPENKRIEIALTSIYGIGRSRSGQILNSLKINLNKRSKDLTEKELSAIREELGKFRIESDLRREIMSNVKRLQDINSYRGIRHKKGLPVRGQRTKTNMRTRKGNKRVTLTSGKRKLEKT